VLSEAQRNEESQGLCSFGFGFANGARKDFLKPISCSRQGLAGDPGIFLTDASAELLRRIELKINIIPDIVPAPLREAPPAAVEEALLFPENRLRAG
jgi:hypothetical protein